MPDVFGGWDSKTSLENAPTAADGHAPVREAVLDSHGAEPGDAPTAGRRPLRTPLVRALRPHQWTKNVLVLVPLIAAHRFDRWDLWLAGALSFVAFSRSRVKQRWRSGVHPFGPRSS